MYTHKTDEFAILSELAEQVEPEAREATLIHLEDVDSKNKFSVFDASGNRLAYWFLANLDAIMKMWFSVLFSDWYIQICLW